MPQRPKKGSARTAAPAARSPARQRRPTREVSFLQAIDNKPTFRFLPAIFGFETLAFDLLTPQAIKVSVLHTMQSVGVVESWTEWDRLREVWVGSLEKKSLGCTPRARSGSEDCVLPEVQLARAGQAAGCCLPRRGQEAAAQLHRGLKAGRRHRATAKGF